MEFIVLDINQKEGLEKLRQSFPGEFKPWSDYEPTAIKNNLWVLPLSVLTDPDFSDFYAYVMENKTTEMVIREVTEDEFIEYEI